VSGQRVNGAMLLANITEAAKHKGNALDSYIDPSIEQRRYKKKQINKHDGTIGTLERLSLAAARAAPLQHYMP